MEAIKGFIAQLKNPLIVILLFASFISTLLGRLTDGLVIIVVVAVNSIFGTFWELRAQNALASLKKYLAVKVKVIINGNEVEVGVEELKSGDQVLVESGDRVPADGILIQSSAVKIDESPLTGESIPVEKNVRSKVFAGSLVLVGSGIFKVEKTGSQTQIGQIAKTVAEHPEVATPLQNKILNLGKFLAIFLLLAAVFIFVIGAILKYELGLMFTTAVALAVASVPEGLPIAVTVVLAAGVLRMAKRKAIVAKLASVEALGAVTVIATDKTGTLTKGEIQAVKVYLPTESILEDVDNLKASSGLAKLLIASALCNNARIRKDDVVKIIGDPLEAALLTLAQEFSLNWQKLRSEFTRIAEFPFDPKLRYMATLNQVPKNSPIFSGKQILFVKGAPRDVISLCDSKLDMEELFRVTEKMAKQGLRVLAIAAHSIGQSWKGIDRENIAGKLVFLGLVGFADEVRPEAAQTVDDLERAGIKVLMVTGDHELTAIQVAKQTGIFDGRQAVTWGLNKSPEEILENLSRYAILARVPPDAKMAIVAKLQADGEIVAMTGDGVNDGPALVAADVGVALGEHGTDVAKDAADIVLTDDNLATIYSAVIEGRTIFANIRKIVTYLLSDSFAAIILTIGAIFLGLPLPLLPAQILWINLVTDSLPDIALAFEPVEARVLTAAPSKNSQILTGELKFLVFLIAGVSGFATLFLFVIVLALTNNLEYARTLTFAALGANTLVYVFSVRSLADNLWQINLFSNKFLLLSVLFGFSILFFGIYFPPLKILFDTVSLEIGDWLIVLGVCTIVVLLIELTKTIIKQK